MFKKISILVIVLCLTMAVGCRKSTPSLSVDKGDEPSIPEITVPEEPVYAVNPLTGLEDLDPQKANQRPVAITVNNVAVAQKVQTGLAKADIVYETEVEGGITRLVAVYKDISDIEKIGTVRSARYAFIDLALGHNAIYVHHGQDGKYAKPHLKDVDSFTVSEGKGRGGVRISNGLAREHTLYAYGDGLWSALKNAGFKTVTDNNANWVTFGSEDTPVTLENIANSVNVPFSTSYKTTFKYDTVTQKYIRYFNGTERKDYNTGKFLYFKNVFVLLTSISDYSDGYHRRVALEGGEGYYITNGTYTPIKWIKGSSKNGFKFTRADGTELTVSPGNSWVCLADKYRAKPIFE